MDSKEYFEVLAEDLKAANLSAGQVREALLYQITSEDEKQVIAGIVAKKFAGWIPEGQISSPGMGYDFQADTSYQGGVKRANDDEVEEVNEDEVIKRDKKYDELVKLVTETATLADEKGLRKQADFLDNLLFDLL